MVVCTICEEDIPKVKRCAHGKKPVNCGGPCLTAYVGEHEATCEGEKTTRDKGKAKDAGEEVGPAKLAEDGEDKTEAAQALETTSSQQEATRSYADLADTNASAADGILKIIREMRHMPALTTCRNCNKTKRELNLTKIRKCTGCGLVGYCRKECQRQHWQAEHKEECKNLRHLSMVQLSKEEVVEQLKGLDVGDVEQSA